MCLFTGQWVPRQEAQLLLPGVLSWGVHFVPRSPHQSLPLDRMARYTVLQSACSSPAVDLILSRVSGNPRL